MDTRKHTTPSPEAQAECLAEADGLIRSMLSYLEADLVYGADLLSTDRAWMKHARAYLESRSAQPSPNSNGGEK